jgi:FMN phosphatase YigB (HAD superfamily)
MSAATGWAHGIAAITFDLGDTITDLGEDRGDYASRLVGRAGRVYDLLAEEGAHLPARQSFCADLAQGCEGFYQAALAEQRGVVLHDALRHLFGLWALPSGEALLERCADAYGRPGAQGAPLRLGAAGVLAELHGRGLRLGVISNTIQPGRQLDLSLANAGLLPYFAARTYSSEVGAAKPHPRIFLAALAALAVPAERTLHVGDRLVADIYGAQQAGMRAVLIAVAGRTEAASGPDGKQIEPDGRINELTELPGLLDLFGMP